MAKMNFKDALNKSLQVTKQYIDEQIVENKFSGDYNDLENRPCYDDRVFEEVDLVYDGSLEGKTTVAANENMTLVKISDDFMSSAELVESLQVLTLYHNGEEYDLDFRKGAEYEGLQEAIVIAISDDLVYVDEADIYVALNEVKLKDVGSFAATVNDDAIISQGIWFGHYIAESITQYTVKMRLNVCDGELKQLDGKLLPEGLPYDDRVYEEIELSFDGNIEGRKTAQIDENTLLVNWKEDVTKEFCEDFIEGIVLTYPFGYSINFSNNYIYELENGNYYIDEIGYLVLNGGTFYDHICDMTVSLDKGLWITFYPNTEYYTVASIKYNSRISGEIHKIREKFLPDSVVMEHELNSLTFSGDYNDLENRPCYDDREFETVQILCDGNFEGKETLEEMPYSKIADLNDNDIDCILSNGYKAIIKLYEYDENNELALFEDLVLDSLRSVIGFDGLYCSKDDELVMIAVKDITDPISISKGLWVFSGNTDTMVCTYDISYDRLLSGELKQLNGELLPEGLPYDSREFEEVILAIDENFDITGKETVVLQVEEIENEETVTNNKMFVKLYDSDFDVKQVIQEGLLKCYGQTFPANDYYYQDEEYYLIINQFIVAEKSGTVFTKGIWGLYSVNEELYYNPDEDELVSLIFKVVKNGELHIMDSKFIPYKPGLIIEEGTEVFPSIWYIDEESGVYGVGDDEFFIGKGAEIFNDYYTDINDYSVGLINRNIAVGNYSHAEGRASYAKGDYSHTEGYNTYAAKDCAHAEGHFCQAVGEHSHAEGSLTQALGKNQHVQGILNIPDPDNKYAHIVGNGILEDEEYLDGITFSNAHTLDWDGNAWFQGQVQGTNLPHDTRVFEETELIFDGNTEGKEVVMIEDPNAPVSLSDVSSKLVSTDSYYAKISDKAISYEEFCDTISIATTVDTEEDELSREEIEQMLIKINDNVFVIGQPIEYGVPPVIVITHENITVDSLMTNTTNNLILTPGIWFMYVDENTYISKFKYQGIISGELKKLDEKYLPDFIANGINVITEEDLNSIFESIDDDMMES